MGCKCPILFFSSARVPCVIKGLMKCSACIEIKKSVCQKRQCKEAIAMRELANWGLDGHAGTESRSVHTCRALLIIFQHLHKKYIFKYSNRCTNITQI
jgi:hypothetical protein